MFKNILVCCLGIILVAVLLYKAVAENLDRPIPVYQNGEIHAFETPDGRIESTDERFGQLIKSYK